LSGSEPTLAGRHQQNHRAAIPNYIVAPQRKSVGKKTIIIKWKLFGNVKLAVKLKAGATCESHIILIFRKQMPGRHNAV